MYILSLAYKVPVVSLEKKDFSDLNNFTIYNLLLIAKQLNIHNGKPKHLCYEELIESIKANIVFE